MQFSYFLDVAIDDNTLVHYLLESTLPSSQTHSSGLWFNMEAFAIALG